MLRREQLEDIVRCNKGEIACGECNNKDNRCRRGRIFGKGTSIKDSGCMGNAAQTALTLADMLKRLDRENDVCPICGLDKAYGHEKGCELAALLKGLEVEG